LRPGVARTRPGFARMCGSTTSREFYFANIVRKKFAGATGLAHCGLVLRGRG
jgi:hypothetical protein